VVKGRGQHCGDIELVGYLANVVDPVPLVLDPNPNNLDQSLNDTTADKLRIHDLIALTELLKNPRSDCPDRTPESAKKR
jgi:hypothetical protein